MSWQLGLVEREINEILRGNVSMSRPSHEARRLSKKTAFLDMEDDQGESSGELSQRPISEEDVCPICQEEFLAKRIPVTYCRWVLKRCISLNSVNYLSLHVKASKPMKQSTNSVMLFSKHAH